MSTSSTWRTLSKANGLVSKHYSSPFFLIIKLSLADPCSPRPTSLHGVAHSFYIELAQALITPQHFNPENFRGVVVIRRLVNPSFEDHVCNVQMAISVVFSFRFASFSSIDCTLTTTWCLRLAQICLSFDEPAFSTCLFQFLTASRKCRLEGKGKPTSSAPYPLLPLIMIRYPLFTVNVLRKPHDWP